jgi:hypothetical protein
MVKKKKEEIVPVIETVEVKEENTTDELVWTPTVSLAMQEFCNQNKEQLFKEIAGLVTADFQDNPPRVVLTVTKELKTLPSYEYNNIKIVFEQMILGGVIIQRDSVSPNIKSFGSSAQKAIDGQKLEDVFGNECIGPHNPKGKKGEAFDAWQKKYAKFTKVE